MSTMSEVPAKSLTQLVAIEIKVQMARADVRQSQLARRIEKTEQWLSVRLRGRQPIDINDLALIAKGLGVGIHDLLPPPEVAAQAGEPKSTGAYLSVAERTTEPPARPPDNRPSGRPMSGSRAGPGRTSYLPRSKRSKVA